MIRSNPAADWLFLESLKTTAVIPSGHLARSNYLFGKKHKQRDVLTSGDRRLFSLGIWKPPAGSLCLGNFPWKVDVYIGQDNVMPATNRFTIYFLWYFEKPPNLSSAEEDSRLLSVSSG